MTRNQERARLLATALLSGEIKSSELRDEDWALLLLAADMQNVRAPAGLVAQSVLANYENHTAYFAPCFVCGPMSTVNPAYN
jgi:hypothetical protein